ncbi:MAG TPA: FtsW/RodA/SpoVE family cell cycle protein [Ktedonobacteraceae bacterium]
MVNQSTGLSSGTYRWKELGLLIVPFLILLVGMTQLLLVAANDNTQAKFSLKNLPPTQSLLPIFGLIGVLLIANIIMSMYFRKADQVLLPLCGFLSGIGVLMAIRLGPPLGQPNLGSKQLLFVLIAIAVGLFVVFMLKDMAWLSRYKYSWALISFLILIPSVINGLKSLHSAAPTHDSITIPGLGTQLQPSEFLKISIVVFFAGYLTENRDVISQGFSRLGGLRLPPLRQLGPLVLMLGVALIFFLIVRELGIALLIYGLFLSMTYLASGQLRYVLINLGIFVVLALVGYALLNYVRARFAVVTFDVIDWQKWTQAQDNFATGPGLQVVQGIIALSSGGILGSGLGQGAPWLVPVAQSDMIVTALGEELGLAGLLAIIGIYLLIVYRGFRIAIEATDPFNKLLAAGLTSIFALQTAVVCAGNLKFFPLTGISLPFIAAGGSSLFANFIIIGILLRISHNTAMEREGLV